MLEFTYVFGASGRTRMKSQMKYLAGLALFVAVSVHAQTAPPPAPALSLSKMSERAGQLTLQVDDDTKAIRHLQALARKAKDVIKLTCVNDKLVQVKAQQNLFDDSQHQFEDSASQKQTETARSAFEALDKAAADIKNLRSEAEACIGVPELSKQESDVSVDAPDLVDPATDDPFQGDVEAPGYASPYN